MLAAPTLCTPLGLRKQISCLRTTFARHALRICDKLPIFNLWEGGWVFLRFNESSDVVE